MGFVGIKMLIADFYKINIGASLTFIASVIALSVIVSLIWPKKQPQLSRRKNNQDFMMAEFLNISQAQLKRWAKLTDAKARQGRRNIFSRRRQGGRRTFGKRLAN